VILCVSAVSRVSVEGFVGGVVRISAANRSVHLYFPRSAMSGDWLVSVIFPIFSPSHLYLIVL